MKTKKSEFDVPTKFNWPKLRCLNAEDRQLLELLPQEQHALDVTIADNILTIKFPTSIEPTALMSCVRMKVEDRELDLHCSADLFPLVLHAMGYGVKINQMTSASAALTANFVLLRLLTGQKEANGLTVVSYLRDGKPLPKLAIPFSLVDTEGKEEGVWISADAETLHWVSACLTNKTTQAASNQLHSLRIPAQIFGPDFDLSSEHLRSLCVGDGLVLPIDWAALDNRSVTLADHLKVAVSLVDGQWVCRTKPARMSVDETQPIGPMIMSTLSKQEDPTEDLPVTINLEVSRTKIPLSDLRKLSSGSVLPFDDKLSTNARLLIEGEVFAEGELVKLDGKIAIRLTRIV